MGRVREVLVPSGAVHELLGLSNPVGIRKLPSMFDVNLRKLTVTDPSSPALGEWVDRKQVLRWMQAWDRHTGGSEILGKMISEFREAMG